MIGLLSAREASLAHAAIARLEARLDTQQGPPLQQQAWSTSDADLPGPMSLTLPHKLGLALVNPRKLQLERGGCWAFTAVGLLEHSYRRQGVARGWLQPDEYLRLSEQAFGVAVLDACRAHPSSCVFDGDQIASGDSTEGGEVPVLYYLRALGANAALPWSVCPYTMQAGNDRLCPGLEAARETSPLRFEVRSMSTYYERVDVKAALLSSGRALGLSTTMANVEYRVPCTEESRHLLGCDPTDLERCVPCPMEPPFAGLGCCVLSERPMNNLHGEFFGVAPLYVRHSPLRLEGGHAMVCVRDHERAHP